MFDFNEVHCAFGRRHDAESRHASDSALSAAPTCQPITCEGK